MIDVVKVLKLFIKEFDEFPLVKRYDYKTVRITNELDFWKNSVIKVVVEMFDTKFAVYTRINSDSDDLAIAKDLLQNMSRAIFRFPNKHKYPEKKNDRQD